MPVPRQADPHASTYAINDPALMALYCVGAGHHGAISPRHWRVPVPLCRHRQVHQVAGSNLVVKINKQSAVKFIKSIICRFDISNRIITDNESQFTSGAFHRYCEDLVIQI
jgi:hypothetical protein